LQSIAGGINGKFLRSQKILKNLKKDGNNHEIPTFYKKMLVYIEDLQN